MNLPIRVQLRRTRGWRKPANTVNVARPTKWGNPWSVARVGAVVAVDCYRTSIACRLAAGLLTIKDIREELGGKNLACWCKPGQPCHADLLLYLANAATGDEQDIIRYLVASRSPWDYERGEPEEIMQEKGHG